DRRSDRRHQELPPRDSVLGDAPRARGGRGDHARRRALAGDGRALLGAQGAWLEGAPLRVSTVSRLRDAMVTHSSLNLLRVLDGGRLWDGFVRLVDETDRQRGFGDYFGYTFVLRGQAEIMLEADVKPWDIAPFKILFEEAGGRFT